VLLQEHIQNVVPVVRATHQYTSHTARDPASNHITTGANQVFPTLPPPNDGAYNAE